RRRGVRVRPVCVLRSRFECVLEEDGSLRLGLNQVQGLNRQRAAAMVQERDRKPFGSLNDLRRRAGLDADELRTLAAIGALNVFTGHRRAGLWEVERPLREGELFDGAGDGSESPLRPMNPFERVGADYEGLRL